MISFTEMAAQPRPQFNMQQRNYLAFEYHKRRGGRGFKPELLADYQAKFPGSRLPSTNQIKNIWEKQMEKGTVLNCNSKSSPGDTYSGRRRSVRTPANTVLVKGVMDRDSVKVTRASS